MGKSFTQAECGRLVKAARENGMTVTGLAVSIRPDGSREIRTVAQEVETASRAPLPISAGDPVGWDAPKRDS